MIIVEPAVRFSFNYAAYDQNSSLYVRAFIYEVSTGTPSLVQTINLSSVQISNGIYSGSFIPSTQKAYLIVTAVFTDNTYTTLNNLYFASSEVYKCVDCVPVFFGFSYGLFTEDASAFVAGNIFDTVTGTPTPVTQIPMSHVFAGVYFGSYNGTLNHTYDVAELVYTDSGYTAINHGFAPKGESFIVFPIQVVIKNVLAEATIKGQLLRATLRETL